jgi:bifunctional DNA-binding transcriptional regulator/antitoxin component of YhaV-PrlF toxin-antitoxin module
MEKSRLDKKYQTTVPREVRDELGLGPGDVLLWEVIGGVARVRPATRAFLARRGSIRVGPGSTVDDVRRARRHRGRGLSSQVVEAAATGDEVGIANVGHPLPRPQPTESLCAPRRPGAWKGEVWMGEDFDEPLPPECSAGFGLDSE